MGAVPVGAAVVDAGATDGCGGAAGVDDAVAGDAGVGCEPGAAAAGVPVPDGGADVVAGASVVTGGGAGGAGTGGTATVGGVGTAGTGTSGVSAGPPDWVATGTV